MAAEEPRTRRLKDGLAYRLAGVVKTYPGATEYRALRGVWLEVARGELLAITGRSGAGKSTLLHMLGGLDTPSSGSIEMRLRDREGVNLGALSESARAKLRRLAVGFMFQAHHLVPTMRCWENVAVPLVFRGEKRESRREAAIVMLGRLGVGAKAHRLPHELSGGEQQRVALARALVHRPEILLADEPTGNLDSDSASRVSSLLAELHAEHGMTTVMVTHDLVLAASLASRIVAIDDGRITTQGRHE
jgi:putative ABC transport system ATP-binding protein